MANRRFSQEWEAIFEGFLDGIVENYRGNLCPLHLRDLYNEAFREGYKVRREVYGCVNGYFICKLCATEHHTRGALSKLLKHGAKRYKQNVKRRIYVCINKRQLRVHLKRDHKYQIVALMPSSWQAKIYAVQTIA